MYKGYKVRLFPTPEQEELLWKHVNACRFIWNYMLGLQEKRYKDGEKRLSGFDMINLLKPLKNDGEHEWLYEVNNGSLKTVCRDLDKAYKEFFKKNAKLPRFKSRKKAKLSYPLRQDKGVVYFQDRLVTIPSVKKMKYKTNYSLPEGRDVKFTNPRISYINGKWILSFGLEIENQDQELTDKSMGIDLGIKELAVVSFGDESKVFHNINKSKRVRTLERKLKHVQRVIARKYKTNGNYEKTNGILKYEKIAKEIQYKIINIRKNYIHQTTHEIVSMLPKRVVMEDLNVSGMMKNKHLSKAIAQQNFYEFIRQMQYKCEWNGIEFVQADRFYPSSKKCSCCGKIKKDLKLSDRVYRCSCGLEIDRDYNAAINLMKYAEPSKRSVA